MANHGTNASTPPCVFFSITTQSPIHELWAHYAVVRAGVRVFESRLWGLLEWLMPERAEDFMARLNSMCAWGTGVFMRPVVEQLRKVAVKAGTSSLPYEYSTSTGKSGSEIANEFL